MMMLRVERMLIPFKIFEQIDTETVTQQFFKPQSSWKTETSASITQFSVFSYLICGLFVLILYFVFNRENDPPNKEVSQQLIKEVQEVEQIKNDSLCTERRILG